MTDADAPPAVTPPATPATLADHIRAKMADAPSPLKLADLKKGWAPPGKKVPAAVLDANIREVLVGEERAGRTFVHPSGPKGAERYWGRDEKHAAREAALAAAAAPVPLADLAKKVKPVSGADAAFVDGLLRDLIAEDRLFEHPPAGKGKNAKPRFGTTAYVPPPPPPPPPHPLEVGKNKTAFGKLVEAARKLAQSAKLSTGEVLSRLATALGGEATAEAAPEPPPPRHEPARPVGIEPAPADLDDHILDIIRGVPTMMLSDLRLRMPEGHRGGDFDAAVLRLADDFKVVINADADPRRFAEDERARFVRDEDGNVYTTIAKRG